MLSSTFTHTTSGRRFTVTGEGPFGPMSSAGTWDDGTEGVIFTEEKWGNGDPVWVRDAA